VTVSHSHLCHIRGTAIDFRRQLSHVLGANMKQALRVTFLWALVTDTCHSVKDAEQTVNSA